MWSGKYDILPHQRSDGARHILKSTKVILRVCHTVVLESERAGCCRELVCNDIVWEGITTLHTRTASSWIYFLVHLEHLLLQIINHTSEVRLGVRIGLTIEHGHLYLLWMVGQLSCLFYRCFSLRQVLLIDNRVVVAYLSFTRYHPQALVFVEKVWLENSHLSSS